MGNSNIKYSFDSNVSTNSRITIKQTFENIQSKVSKNMEFFNGINVRVFGSWEESYEYSQISDGRMGFTTYPINSDLRNIYLQTKEVNRTSTSLITGFGASSKSISETAAHELGHTFDYYFATPDAEIVNELREMYTLGAEHREKYKKKYNKLLEKYKTRNGLSDSEKFKQAWKQDVENKFMNKNDTSSLNERFKLGYFSPTYSFDNKFSKIKLKDGIDDKELLMADRAREEIFAQLFAYAFGECCDNKEKELIIQTYPACYKVVKNYINEYFGIDVDKTSQINLDISL